MNAIHLKHMNYLNADERHLAKKHATITKDTAVGFAEWIVTNKDMIQHNGGNNWYCKFIRTFRSHDVFDRVITTSELYDLYVKSLEG